MTISPVLEKQIVPEIGMRVRLVRYDTRIPPVSRPLKRSGQVKSNQMVIDKIEPVADGTISNVTMAGQLYRNRNSQLWVRTDAGEDLHYRFHDITKEWRQLKFEKDINKWVYEFWRPTVIEFLLNT